MNYKTLDLETCKDLHFSDLSITFNKSHQEAADEVILKLNTIIFRLDLTIEYPVICKKLRAAANT